MWFSTTQGDKLANPAPFGMVAIAGHVIGSNAFCHCGPADCVCDPDEIRKVPGDSQQGQTPTADFGATATNEVGLGFLALTMLLLWLKLRA